MSMIVNTYIIHYTLVSVRTHRGKWES